MAGRADPRVNPGEAPSFVVEAAQPGDDAALRELLRSRPMRGQIELSMEREPSFFEAHAIEGDLGHTIVVRESPSGRIVGAGTRSVRDVWIDGQPARLGYLGSLRAAPGSRGRRRLAAGYRAVEATHRPDEQAYDLTSVVSDNATARRLLERGIPGLPRYTHLFTYETRLLATARGKHRSDPRVRDARPEDLPEIVACLRRNLQRYQFAPRYCERELLDPRLCRALSIEDFCVVTEQGSIVGCAALWDQRSFKQIVVRRYARNVARWRPALNGLFRLTGQPSLPPVGTTLALGYVSHLAVDRDRYEWVSALVRRLRARASAVGLELLALGYAAAHPWRPEMRREFRGRSYASEIYRVEWPPEETAERKLEAESEPGGDQSVRTLPRLPHLEVSRL